MRRLKIIPSFNIYPERNNDYCNGSQLLILNQVTRGETHRPNKDYIVEVDGDEEERETQ